MKKTLALLLSFIILLGQSFMASAATMPSAFMDIDSSLIESVTYLDNGNILVKGKVAVLRSGIRWTTDSVTYHYLDANGVILWSATLTGTFYYDDTVSYCTNSSCTTSVQHGNWSETANTVLCRKCRLCQCDHGAKSSVYRCPDGKPEPDAHLRRQRKFVINRRTRPPDLKNSAGGLFIYIIINPHIHQHLPSVSFL